MHSPRGGTLWRVSRLAGTVSSCHSYCLLVETCRCITDAHKPWNQTSKEPLPAYRSSHFLLNTLEYNGNRYRERERFEISLLLLFFPKNWVSSAYETSTRTFYETRRRIFKHKVMKMVKSLYFVCLV